MIHRLFIETAVWCTTKALGFNNFLWCMHVTTSGVSIVRQVLKDAEVGEHRNSRARHGLYRPVRVSDSMIREAARITFYYASRKDRERYVTLKKKELGSAVAVIVIVMKYLLVRRSGARCQGVIYRARTFRFIAFPEDDRNASWWMLTFDRWELIQFMKVFFCTRSCSSGKGNARIKRRFHRRERLN